MNLQQMRYVLAVAANGSFREAAKVLYISQPSLSHSIKQLEQELEAPLFARTHQGTRLTTAGQEFVLSAEKIIQQVDHLQQHFATADAKRHYFSVAGQHYDFIAVALCQVLAQYNDYRYIRVFESTALEVIKDVAQGHSELGILFLNDYNQSSLLRLFEQDELTYEELGLFQTHIFMRTQHPLAYKTKISLADLAPYPQVRFTQEASYPDLAEDPLEPPVTSAMIAVSDRATMSRIVARTDAYGSGSGILEAPGEQGLIMRPLLHSPRNRMIILRRKEHELSEIGQYFVTALRAYFATQHSGLFK
ncbi:LysR family transcriptional regulator [Loigolactobacillus binensis]|uniref:LysR family transcriptional regulator n=1 Tax=Loigolactobacillus binensis TaxID=2559922 RepID=A0ABW3EBM5_9LACO|nr:LysR family transcriptional regulator [Loigolactobacillus binensis]